MNDAIDAGMDNANDEEAADQIYSQICDEIGVDLAEENDVNKGKIAMGSEAAPVVIFTLSHKYLQKNDVDDLQSRLDQLKR